MHPCCNINQEKCSTLPGNLDCTHILFKPKSYFTSYSAQGRHAAQHQREGETI